MAAVIFLVSFPFALLACALRIASQMSPGIRGEAFIDD
jgi:hypothetical protein